MSSLPAEPVETFSYGEPFQAALLSQMMTDDVFYIKCLRWLKSTYFTREDLVWFFNQLNEFYSQFHRKPTYPEISSRIALYRPDQRDPYYRVVAEIQQSTAIGLDYLKKTLTAFIRLNKFAEYYRRSGVMFNRTAQTGGEFDNVYSFTAEAMQELNDIDFNDDRVLDFDKTDVLLSKNVDHVKRAIPTGIFAIDRAMAGLTDEDDPSLVGGLLPQTLAVVLGTTNDGKSNTLINIMYHAVKAGKRVVYLCHEDGEYATFLKILSRFTRIPISRFRAGALTDQERTLVAGAKDYLKRHVVLKFLYGDDANIEDIGNWLRIKHREKPFDMFIDDYGQLVRSRQSFDSVRFLNSFVYNEFRNLALELDISVVSVAQGNRTSKMIARAGDEWLRVQHLSECVAEDVGVLTRHGYVPIQNITPGDEVMTHLGRWRKVLSLSSKGKKPVLSVKADGLLPVLTTNDHLFLTKDNGWVEAEKLLGNKVVCPKYRLSYTVESGSVMDLYDYCDKEKYIANREIIYRTNRDGSVNRKYNSIKRYVTITNEFCYFIGLLIAEGTIASDGGVICVDLHKDEKSLQDVVVHGFRDFFGLELIRGWRPETCNGWSVRVNCRILNEVFFNLIGRHATKKHLPLFIWDAEPSLRTSLMEGIFAGDGYTGSNRSQSLGLANRGLIYDIHALAWGTDRYFSVGEKRNYARPNSGFWVINESMSTDRHSSSAMTRKVMSISPAGEKNVYDLMVEDDESFVIDGGIVVHNCFDIGMKSDYVISLNVSDELRRERKLVFFLDKNKHGQKEIAVQCDMDYSRIITHQDQRPLQRVINTGERIQSILSRVADQNSELSPSLLSRIDFATGEVRDAVLAEPTDLADRSKVLHPDV